MGLMELESKQDLEIEWLITKANLKEWRALYL